MKRRRAREYALMLLFEYDFTGCLPDRKVFWEGKTNERAVISFAESIAKGAVEHLAEIDAAIEKAAEHWVLERMAAVDRNIMRAAAYELLHKADIPSAVAINEAIEIAKKFSTAESAAFINGILDRIARARPKAPAGAGKTGEP
jgi:N utilization substance protein B